MDTYNDAVGEFRQKERSYMAHHEDVSVVGDSHALFVLSTSVPEQITVFLKRHGLTGRVISLADKDIDAFPGVHRKSIETARTKCTIASVLHQEMKNATSDEKRAGFQEMFELTCDDIVHDMQQEQQKAWQERGR